MSDRSTQIINAAIRLFAEDGIAVPTAKIAKEAQVSNGTLFNYFATKQDLIDSVYLSIKEEMAAHILGGLSFDAQTRDWLHHIWRAYIYWSINNPAKHQVLNLLATSQTLSDKAKDVADAIFQNISDKLEEDINNQAIVNVSVDYFCEITCAQINALISYATNNKLAGKQLDENIDTSFSIFWSGVGK